MHIGSLHFRSMHRRAVRPRSVQRGSVHAGSGLQRSGHPDPTAVGDPGRPGAVRDGESGSLVTEYGLIAIVGATLAGLAIRWASDGAVLELFEAIMGRIQSIVGV